MCIVLTEFLALREPQWFTMVPYRSSWTKLFHIQNAERPPFPQFHATIMAFLMAYRSNILPIPPTVTAKSVSNDFCQVPGLLCSKVPPLHVGLLLFHEPQCHCPDINIPREHALVQSKRSPVYRFLSPTLQRPNQANYVLCLGTLGSAIVMWQNSLVFHSLDKLTSFFLHFFPPLHLHLFR